MFSFISRRRDAIMATHLKRTDVANLSSKGKGVLVKALGRGVPLEWFQCFVDDQTGDLHLLACDMLSVNGDRKRLFSEADATRHESAMGGTLMVTPSGWNTSLFFVRNPTYSSRDSNVWVEHGVLMI